MQIENSITIRDLLWEWSRAYPERPGDCVDWYRQAHFAAEIVSDGYPEERPPIDYQRAERTDEAVKIYLQALRRQKDRARSIREEFVFWDRYYDHRKMASIGRIRGRSEKWVRSTCELIERSVEMALHSLPDDLTGTAKADTFVQAAVFTQ